MNKDTQIAILKHENFVLRKELKKNQDFILKLSGDMQIIKAALAKTAPVERAVRNSLPKGSVNMTTAAKYFCVHVYAFTKALREQTSILYKGKAGHNLIRKPWRNLGYMAVENSQPFITPRGIEYLEGMIKRGELRFN